MLTVTVRKNKDNSRYNFALSPSTSKIAYAMQFISGRVTRDTKLAGRAPSFKSVSGFFFDAQHRVISGVTPQMAPPYFFPSGFTNAVYDANSRARKSYVPAGMFIFAKCNKMN
jgi:hypothetical protein